MTIWTSLGAALLLVCGAAHANSYVYPDFSDPAGLRLNGAARIVGGDTLRLTPARTTRRGSLFTDFGVDARAFKTAFQFKIGRSDGTAADCDGELGGEGFAFVLQGSSSTALGAAGGGLGYEGIPTSFAVEFDTFCNPDRNDPSSNHIGLIAGGSTVHVDLPTKDIVRQFDSGAVYSVWIDYDGTHLEIRLSRSDSRPSEPVLRRAVDIPALIGGPLCCAGFTAATGEDAVGAHLIYSWNYEEDDDLPPLGDADRWDDNARPRPVCRNR